MTSAGDLIKGHRVSSGLTQHQLAVRAGTTKTAISRLEAGHVSPSIDTLDRLLLCMGLRLQLSAVPIEPATDVTQLGAVADLSHTARLDHGLASMRSLSSVLGAARES